MYDYDWKQGIPPKPGIYICTVGSQVCVLTFDGKKFINEKNNAIIAVDAWNYLPSAYHKPVRAHTLSYIDTIEEMLPKLREKATTETDKFVYSLNSDLRLFVKNINILLSLLDYKTEDSE